MRIVATLSSSVIVLLCAAPALAGAAQADLQTGITLFHAGDLAGSRRILLSVDGESQEPAARATLELYLGMNDVMEGAGESATQHFTQALTLNPELTLDPTRFKKRLMDSFEAVRATLEGALLVATQPSGASVLVDGVPRGNAPLRLSLPPGAHLVEAKGSQSTRVVVPVGREVTVTLSLEPSARPRPAEKPAPASPQPAPRPRRLWTWVALGGTVVAAGVAGGLLGSALHQRYGGEWDDKSCSRTFKMEGDECDELGHSIRTKEITAYALFGTAAVLAASTVVLYFVEGRSRSAAPTRGVSMVSPLVGAGAGLALGGRF